MDVVNENNQVIGQESRRIIHKSGLWHRGVHVFLFTSDRRLLTQRRSNAQDTFSGALACSVSEHLRVGESYLDRAIRGLREELGIEQIRLSRLLQLNINQREIEQIAYHAISEIEGMMASGEVPFISWFVQLVRWHTGKPADMQVLWARRDVPLRQQVQGRIKGRHLGERRGSIRSKLVNLELTTWPICGIFT